MKSPYIESAPPARKASIIVCGLRGSRSPLPFAKSLSCVEAYPNTVMEIIKWAIPGTPCSLRRGNILVAIAIGNILNWKKAFSVSP